jgi:hypothetical protein
VSAVTIPTGELVVRPGGRVYRARKRPYAEVLGWDWNDQEIVVWRTHDVDVAVALAHQACVRLGCDLLGVPTCEWAESVPWDVSGGGYDYTVRGCAPTVRGATPVVWFR